MAGQIHWRMDLRIQMQHGTRSTALEDQRHEVVQSLGVALDCGR